MTRLVFSVSMSPKGDGVVVVGERIDASALEVVDETSEVVVVSMMVVVEASEVVVVDGFSVVTVEDVVEVDPVVVVVASVVVVIASVVVVVGAVVVVVGEVVVVVVGGGAATFSRVSLDAYVVVSKANAMSSSDRSRSTMRRSTRLLDESNAWSTLPRGSTTLVHTASAGLSVFDAEAKGVIGVSESSR